MSNLNRHPVRRTAAGILAGALAFSGAVAAATPASALPQFDLVRLAGADRYETAAVIARDAFPQGSGTVILASGEDRNFPDALAGNYLAGKLNAPILLTPSARTSAATMTALRNLNARNVIIIGGTSAVSASVASAVDAMTDVSVRRIGGDDRYDTAAAVALEANAGQTGVGVIGGQRTAIVGTGQDAADILAAGPLAFASQFPIIITRPGSLPAESANVLRANGIQRVLIVGGTTAVSQGVEDAITAAGVTTVTRLAGAQRTNTAVAIADFAIANLGFSNSHVNLARQDIFADALAGGPHAGKEKAPILLTAPTTLSPATEEFLRRNAGTLVGGHIFGGFAAISAAVEAAAETAGRTGTGPVLLTSTTVAQGGNLTGTITGDFSSVTFTGCGFTTPQTVGADDNATTAGRQFTIPVSGAQAVGTCDLTFTFTPTGGGAVTTQVVRVNVTAPAAGAVTGTSATTRPELVSAQIVSTVTASQTAAGGGATGTTVRYTFDEEVTGAAARPAAFRLYDFTGAAVTGTPVISAVEGGTAGGRSVLVRFTEVASATAASRLSVATVDFDAVTDAEGQVNPIGDAAVGTGQTIGLTAGTTAAPDLVAVENVRANQTITTQTLVDFRFDEAAFLVNAAARGGFALVLTNGTVVEGTAVEGLAGGTVGVNEVADNTITVSFPNPTGTDAITAAQIARGTINAGTVSDANEATTVAGARAGSVNPLQASDTPDAATSDPDLVSATFFANGSDPDQVVFTFDEPVALATAANGTFFQVYGSNGVEFEGATIAPRGATSNQVVVTFANVGAASNVGATQSAVGASVDAGAVTSTTGSARNNEEDEVGVANANATAVAAGRTLGPDLTGVALSTSTTATGAQAVATYTFDEDLTRTAATVTVADFFLVQADGTRLQCVVGAVGNTEETDNTFVCTSFRFLTTNAGATGELALNQQVTNAVLGTVDDTAVVDEDGTANVEGAAATTGGTGTPVAGTTPAATAPTVTGLNVTSGGTAGGTVVTITGTNLTGATGVTFGGVAGTSFSVGAGGTSITVTSPAGTAGARDVVVLSPNGNVTRTGGFTFTA